MIDSNCLEQVYVLIFSAYQAKPVAWSVDENQSATVIYKELRAYHLSLSLSQYRWGIWLEMVLPTIIFYCISVWTSVRTVCVGMERCLTLNFKRKENWQNCPSRLSSNMARIWGNRYWNSAIVKPGWQAIYLQEKASLKVPPKMKDTSHTPGTGWHRNMMEALKVRDY